MNYRRLGKFSSLPIDVSGWPDILLSTQPETDKVRIKARIDGLRYYIAGEKLSKIKAETGLCKKTLRRLLQRCLKVHADGRIWGFRACRPYSRVNPYIRTRAVKGGRTLEKAGFSGALAQLFERFPDILEELVKVALRKTGKSFTETGVRMDKIHIRFLQLCEQAGIKRSEYPFNVLSQAERSLARRLNAEILSRNLHAVVKNRYGEDAARRLGFDGESSRIGDKTACYERVEFDGHKLDFVCMVVIDDPVTGEVTELVIERAWLLAIVDCASRAILGYHICLGRQYSADDVLICFENAIRPWEPKSLKIQDLKYREGAGMPSGVLPQLAFAVWGEIAFDNAASHLAQRVKEGLSGVASVLNPGPVKTPEARRVVERLFGILEERYIHRLPNTTGSSSSDVRRDKPEQKAKQYRITFDEMLELMDVIICDYNATPARKHYNRSPLQYLEHMLVSGTFVPRRIPETERPDFSIAVVSATRTVRGNLGNGQRPYIEFEGARYYSERLSSSPDLIGKPLRLSGASKDIRTLTSYLENGEEFGVLRVADKWAAKAHDLRTRRAINQLAQQGQLNIREGEDPIEVFIRYKSSKKKVKKKDGSDIAHALNVIDGGLKEQQSPGGTAVKEVRKIQMPVFRSDIQINTITMNF